jgi:hypothetical protein
MIKEWLEKRGSNKMPPDLAALATNFRIDVEQGWYIKLPAAPFKENSVTKQAL